jgi:hypothetical protein
MARQNERLRRVDRVENRPRASGACAGREPCATELANFMPFRGPKALCNRPEAYGARQAEDQWFANVLMAA